MEKARAKSEYEVSTEKTYRPNHRGDVPMKEVVPESKMKLPPMLDALPG